MKRLIVSFILLFAISAHAQIGGGIFGTPSQPIMTPGSGTGLTVIDLGNTNSVQVYKVTITYAALSAEALTADKVIATLPAKTKIIAAYCDTTTKYLGGGVSAAAMIVGTAAGGSQIIATHDVFTAAISKGAADADMGAGLTRAAAIQGGLMGSWTTTTDIYVRITTVTANTNALTQGSTTIYLMVQRF